MEHAILSRSSDPRRCLNACAFVTIWAVLAFCKMTVSHLRIFGTAALLVSGLSAVETGQPSKTSVWVLAARAIGARDSDPRVRNPDWLAERFLGPEERALIPDHPVIAGLDKDYREAMKEPETRARVLMVNSAPTTSTSGCKTP
jgi:hypothetical protein